MFWKCLRAVSLRVTLDMGIGCSDCPLGVGNQTHVSFPEATGTSVAASNIGNISHRSIYSDPIGFYKSMEADVSQPATIDICCKLHYPRNRVGSGKNVKLAFIRSCFLFSRFPRSPNLPLSWHFVITFHNNCGLLIKTMDQPDHVPKFLFLFLFYKMSFWKFGKHKRKR